MLPPMISYAQNAEDVVLRRVFQDVEDGFYVDVGACVPVDDSVTLHFYEQGWSGVNVEPDPRFHAELVAARPRDVNLQRAVGSGSGPLQFFPAAVRGQGTLDAHLAQHRGATTPLAVEQISLREVLAEHAPGRGVEFLKVDVEGWEAAVLASSDWATLRPRVVVVEAVDAEGRPTHEAWEPHLLAAGYRHGLFDGLNRFYVREEDGATLLPRLEAPANVLDNWRQAREVQQQERLLTRLDELDAAAAASAAELRKVIDDERAAYAASRREAAELARAVAAGKAALETERAALAEERSARACLELSLREARRADAQARDRLAAAERALAAEQAARASERLELEGVWSSTSWRITAPLRDASRLGKVMRRNHAR